MNWLLQRSDSHLSDYILHVVNFMIIMNFAYNKAKSPICLSTTENLLFSQDKETS